MIVRIQYFSTSYSESSRSVVLCFLPLGSSSSSLLSLPRFVPADGLSSSSLSSSSLLPPNKSCWVDVAAISLFSLDSSVSGLAASSSSLESSKRPADAGFLFCCCCCSLSSSSSCMLSSMKSFAGGALFCDRFSAAALAAAFSCSHPDRRSSTFLIFSLALRSRASCFLVSSFIFSSFCSFCSSLLASDAMRCSSRISLASSSRLRSSSKWDRADSMLLLQCEIKSLSMEVEMRTLAPSFFRCKMVSTVSRECWSPLRASSTSFAVRRMFRVSFCRTQLAACSLVMQRL
mmetsp:Transcript_27758/g.65213  ORF Transcript_27758/g.65213 Transcript_27758/m.65213 type:complete len:289 (+) Transcript_27758:245-1111(+)